MKFLATFILFLCFISEGFTQKSLNDYSFVIVPEKFDFVNEKDKYQLNSLTKFLFNKHGFNAYFDSERPNVKRCDGLYAEVIGKPAMIRTKVTVILNDCYGDEVYRTEVGKSKLKAYNKTYTAALRQAFLSIDSLDVQQKDPIIFGEGELEKMETPLLKEEAPSKPSESTDVTVLPSKEAMETISKKISYSSNGANFELNPTKTGYTLYEQSSNSSYVLKGKLVQTNAKDYQFVDTNGNSFPASFDSEENLVIQTSFQKLEFKKVNN